jgi:hypothetical protein
MQNGNWYSITATRQERHLADECCVFYVNSDMGSEAMRREVDRVMSLIADGEYIPELDHSIPPDISGLVFCDYIEYLEKWLV